MICKIKYALYGVRLNVLNFLLSHEYPHREVAPLITCVNDNTWLKTMPDIDQALLQFIDVMNLVDLLLHLSPSVVVKRVQICAARCQRCGEMKPGLESVVPRS